MYQMVRPGLSLDTRSNELPGASPRGTVPAAWLVRMSANSPCAVHRRQGRMLLAVSAPFRWRGGSGVAIGGPAAGSPQPRGQRPPVGTIRSRERGLTDGAGDFVIREVFDLACVGAVRIWPRELLDTPPDVSMLASMEQAPWTGSSTVETCPRRSLRAATSRSTDRTSSVIGSSLTGRSSAAQTYGSAKWSSPTRGHVPERRIRYQDDLLPGRAIR
jgi:hypothetical protein